MKLEKANLFPPQETLNCLNIRNLQAGVCFLKNKNDILTWFSLLPKQAFYSLAQMKHFQRASLLTSFMPFEVINVIWWVLAGQTGNNKKASVNWRNTQHSSQEEHLDNFKIEERNVITVEIWVCSVFTPQLKN